MPSLFNIITGVIQLYSLNTDQEAQRLTRNHPLDNSCLLLSDRLKKHSLQNTENIKYETARHLSIEDIITFQLHFWHVKIKELGILQGNKILLDVSILKR